MTEEKKLKEEITELLTEQKLAVLSTQSSDGFSYASLIAFAAEDDLQTIVFATPKATRKFANLMNNDRISLLIDNRANEENDFHAAKAVTVMGIARERPSDSNEDVLVSLYLRKHPYLYDFLHSPTTALIHIAVLRYYLVTRFQEVMELHLQNEDNLSFI